MDNLRLTASTGDETADKYLRGVIGLLELIFPQRIRAYYVTGSYADKTAVDASDIDLVAVFKDAANESDIETVWDIADALMLLCPVFLDLEGVGEERIMQGGHPLQWNSLFLFGEDIRGKMPVPPMDDYIFTCIRTAYNFISRVARNDSELQEPLDFPDPTSEFYGYDNNPIEGKRDTKVLMAVVGKIATAIIAVKARQHVSTKSECLRLYKELINDEWTGLVGVVYTKCRNEWGYQIPEDLEGRKQLREICERTLAFENYFLDHYLQYLPQI